MRVSNPVITAEGRACLVMFPIRHALEQLSVCIPGIARWRRASALAWRNTRCGCLTRGTSAGCGTR
jgi:hypothetical protein